MQPSSRKTVAWKPDSDAKACAACKVVFTLFNRRHHCRLCGDVFCNDCTSHRYSIEPGSAPVRACSACIKTTHVPSNRLLRKISIIGPPGSGKSALAHVLLGHPYIENPRRGVEQTLFGDVTHAGRRCTILILDACPAIPSASAILAAFALVLRQMPPAPPPYIADHYRSSPPGSPPVSTQQAALRRYPSPSQRHGPSPSASAVVPAPVTSPLDLAFRGALSTVADRDAASASGVDGPTAPTSAGATASRAAPHTRIPRPLSLTHLNSLDCIANDAVLSGRDVAAASTPQAASGTAASFRHVVAGASSAVPAPLPHSLSSGAIGVPGSVCLSSGRDTGSGASVQQRVAAGVVQPPLLGGTRSGPARGHSAHAAALPRAASGLLSRGAGRAPSGPLRAAAADGAASVLVAADGVTLDASTFARHDWPPAGPAVLPSSPTTAHAMGTGGFGPYGRATAGAPRGAHAAAAFGGSHAPSDRSARAHAGARGGVHTAVGSADRGTSGASSGPARGGGRLVLYSGAGARVYHTSDASREGAHDASPHPHGGTPARDGAGQRRSGAAAGTPTSTPSRAVGRLAGGLGPLAGEALPLVVPMASERDDDAGALSDGRCAARGAPGRVPYADDDDDDDGPRAAAPLVGGALVGQSAAADERTTVPHAMADHRASDGATDVCTCGAAWGSGDGYACDSVCECGARYGRGSGAVDTTCDQTAPRASDGSLMSARGAHAFVCGPSVSTPVRKCAHRRDCGACGGALPRPVIGSDESTVICGTVATASHRDVGSISPDAGMRAANLLSHSPGSRRHLLADVGDAGVADATSDCGGTLTPSSASLSIGAFGGAEDDRSAGALSDDDPVFDIPLAADARALDGAHPSRPGHAVHGSDLQTGAEGTLALGLSTNLGSQALLPAMRPPHGPVSYASDKEAEARAAQWAASALADAMADSPARGQHAPMAVAKEDVSTTLLPPPPGAADVSAPAPVDLIPQGDAPTVVAAACGAPLLLGSDIPAANIVDVVSRDASRRTSPTLSASLPGSNARSPSPSPPCLTSLSTAAVLAGHAPASISDVCVVDAAGRVAAGSSRPTTSAAAVPPALSDAASASRPPLASSSSHALRDGAQPASDVQPAARATPAAPPADMTATTSATSANAGRDQRRPMLHLPAVTDSHSAIAAPGATGGDARGSAPAAALLARDIDAQAAALPPAGAPALPPPAEFVARGMQLHQLAAVPRVAPPLGPSPRHPPLHVATPGASDACVASVWGGWAVAAARPPAAPVGADGVGAWAALAWNAASSQPPPHPYGYGALTAYGSHDGYSGYGGYGRPDRGATWAASWDPGVRGTPAARDVGHLGLSTSGRARGGGAAMPPSGGAAADSATRSGWSPLRVATALSVAAAAVAVPSPTLPLPVAPAVPTVATAPPPPTGAAHPGGSTSGTTGTPSGRWLADGVSLLRGATTGISRKATQPSSAACGWDASASAAAAAALPVPTAVQGASSLSVSAQDRRLSTSGAHAAPLAAPGCSPGAGRHSGAAGDANAPAHGDAGAVYCAPRAAAGSPVPAAAACDPIYGDGLGYGALVSALEGLAATVATGGGPLALSDPTALPPHLTIGTHMFVVTCALGERGALQQAVILLVIALSHVLPAPQQAHQQVPAGCTTSGGAQSQSSNQSPPSPGPAPGHCGVTHLGIPSSPDAHGCSYACIVVTKRDTYAPGRLAAVQSDEAAIRAIAAAARVPIFFTSARRRDGVDDVLSNIFATLPPGT